MPASTLLIAAAAALAPAQSASFPVTVYKGLCEASAAVRLDGDRFAVASDEANKLKDMENRVLIYRRGVAEPVGYATIAEVRDLEAAAAADDGTRFWLTSHSMTKKGEDNVKRRELIATSISGQSLTITRRVTGLRARIAALLEVTEWPLQASLNIEGMASTPDGDLLLGLRAPLKRERAAIVKISNAAGLISGSAGADDSSPSEERTVWWLNLGGRGIRSLERVGTGAQAYLIVAGATGEGDNEPALYWWDGSSDTVSLWINGGFKGLLPGKKDKPKDMVPEAAIAWDNGTIEIFGDNESGCSDEDKTENRWFPSVVIPKPAP